jgi:AcrR family transcriptional regulator
VAPQQAAEVEAARPGRPRDDDRESEILAAAVEALVAEGFDAMTIEGVAARVGAGKATLYRRWRNKTELVAAALRRHAGADVPIPDTGDARADLRTYLRGLQAAFNGTDGGLMAAFTIERIRHPELGEAYDRLFVADRRAALRRMVGRAVERGDLPPNTDIELIIDVGPALMLHFFVRHNGRLPRGFADRIADQFLAG